MTDTPSSPPLPIGVIALTAAWLAAFPAGAVPGTSPSAGPSPTAAPKPARIAPATLGSVAAFAAVGGGAASLFEPRTVGAPAGDPGAGAPVAVASAPGAPVAVAPAPAATETKVAPAPTVAAPAGLAADGDSDEDSADDDSDATTAPDEGTEAESHDVTGPAAATGLFYTGDISDAELARVWKTRRASLGSVSVGFTDAGRLINGEQFPLTGGPWTVVDPPNTYGTRETIEYLKTVLRAVDKQFPGGPPMRVNHIGSKDGGYLRPHRSHQSGRDVDLGFYYKTIPGPRAWNRAKFMDLPRNWALIRDLVTMTDVQMILVDRGIQRELYQYALSIGEDQRWLDSLFHAGASSILKHARHHRDHFHVRFYNARAQELGRRLQPLIAQSKEFPSILMHRIRSGDSLGRIARHYGTTVSALRRANRLGSNFIRAGRMLAIPVRGACVNCPLPPPMILPPRHLPPPASPPTLSER